MFSEVGSQTPFFPLSGESPRGVPGKTKEVRAKRGGRKTAWRVARKRRKVRLGKGEENRLSLEVILSGEGQVSLP